jgi:hypothetical protein
MKAPLALIAAAMLMAPAAQAETIIVDRMATPDMKMTYDDGTSILMRPPAFVYEVDRSILYPTPRPFPWPVPPCLSCPPMPFDERVTTPRTILR